MITQSFFYRIQGSLVYSATEEEEQFIRPYALVIHRRTRRGFYLNRDYQHIIDVENCREPVHPTGVAKNHLCNYSNLPAWAITENSREFDTFWLYQK